IQHISTSAHHAGKNIWSLAVHGNEQVATGGADGRIVLASISTNEERVADSVSRQEEWTLEEALSNANARAEPPETCEVSGPDNKQSSVDLAQDSAEAHPSRHISDAPDEAPETKKEKKKTKKSPKPISDSFRTYAFVSEKSILVTTSAGVVMLATMENRGLQWQELGRNSDLRGYSVTTGVNSMGIGLFAGTGGSLYYYDDRTEQLQSIVTRQDGKVSAILAEPVVSAEGEREALGVVLTYVGSDVAKSLVLRRSTRGLDVERIASLQLLPSFIVTSAARVSFNERLDSVFLGSRNGDIAVYLNRLNETHESTSLTPCRVLQNVHGQDAVTTMRWISADHIATEAASGCLVSVGRDGTCAIHQCKTETRHIETLLVHQARTPFGPNVEGVHIELATDTLIFYGFRSKQFVVYNESNNEEIMTIECGG
ncbi:WD repeat-containing protein 6, partial [Cryomyces antarcticus]